MNLQKYIPVVLLGILLSGCQSKTKHYDLKGQVLDKKPSTNEIRVKHDDIAGFMSAMTMSYSVRDQDGFQQVEPGDVITADVITAKSGNEYWLENVRITDESGRKTRKPDTVHRLDRKGSTVQRVTTRRAHCS